MSMEQEGHRELVCSLIMSLRLAQEPDGALARLPFVFPHKIAALHLLFPSREIENG